MRFSYQPIRPIASKIATQVGIIVTLSLIAITVALVTLSYSLRDAKVVNISGSMRMQSYRIAFDLLHNPEQTENHIKLFNTSIQSETMQQLHNWIVPNEIQYEFSNIEQQWHRLSTQLISGKKEAYLQEFPVLVERIDELVYRLQKFSEHKLILLAIVGGSCLLLILIFSILIVLFVKKEIVKPLNQLVRASALMQEKQFDIQLDTNNITELGLLAKSYERMAKELGSLYSHLEERVLEKTQELQEANDSLSLLYESSELISASRLNHDSFDGILNKFIMIQGVSAVQLELKDTTPNQVSLIAGKPIAGALWRTFPLYQGKLYLGELKWQYLNLQPNQDLIESMGRLIARSIYFYQGQKQAEQILLMEERATIARELHDSLAQSLSYLKIQITLLKRQFEKELAPSKQEIYIGSSKIIAEIEDVLSEAYSQLRELLNTFRLKIEAANFGEALSQMIVPLQTQTQAEIKLNNQLASIELNAQQQVHLLQFIREACLNAIKHAKASLIEVNCQLKAEQILIKVIDNGKGFETNKPKPNHYGLTIMQERAARLNGQYQLESKLGEGCEVSLTIEV